MTTSPFKPTNSEIYAPPRNWDVACALCNLRAGVPLTEAQKALVNGKAAA
jgi:hypothetical protein